MKRIRLFGFLSIFSFLFLGTVAVEAANENTPPPYLELDQIFQTPTNSDSQVIHTSAGDIVQLTDALKNQKGAIWSTDNNKMDLSSDFEASMYIYFGDQGTTAADGMAFVMHNDARGNNTSINGVGAQLGVWESTIYGKWDKGIKNSLAIEFDTHDNDGFDADVLENDHIAWNYPGLKSTYQDYLDPHDWFKKKRKLVHQDVQYPEELSTDQWFPFTINWLASTHTLTYQFNNMEPIEIRIDADSIFGSKEVYWGFTGSTGAQVEMKRVVFEKVPGLVNAEVKETIEDQDGNSVDGQTVSSGERLTYRVEGNYLSGKQSWKEVTATLQLSDSVNYVPGTLKGRLVGGTEVSLPDSFWESKSLDVPVGTLDQAENTSYFYFDVEVAPVTVSTNVNESSSFNGKNRIQASNQVTFMIESNQAPILTLEDEETIQTVAAGTAYDVNGTWRDPDGTTETIHYLVNGEEIGSDEETSQGIGQETHCTHRIPAEYLQAGIENIVEVFGVDAQGAETQHLFLKIVTLSAPVMTLEGANTTINLENGSAYEAIGTWKDSDSQWISLYYTLDGGEPIKFANELTNSNEETAYNWTIENTALSIGTHRIEVYGVDSDGQQSNVESVIIKVSGEVQFTTVSDKVSYEDMQIPESVTTAKRNDDWDIRVKDTRGIGSEWHVDVTLEKPFTNQNKRSLNDAFFYKTDSSEKFLSVGVATTVFTKKTTDVNEVAVNWKENQGLLMKIHSSDYSGTYKGLLNWTLVDAP